MIFFILPTIKLRQIYFTVTIHIHGAQLILELKPCWLCCANFQSKQNCGIL